MELIEESALNNEAIAELLQQTYFGFDLSGTASVYVYDGVEFPCWIDIRFDKKLIELWTYAEFSTLEPDELDAACLDFNQRILLPTFRRKERRIYAEYYMTFANGVLRPHIVKMLRRFSSAFSKAISELPDAPPAGEIPGERLHS